MRLSLASRLGLCALLALPGVSIAGPSTIDDLRLGPRWHGFRIEPGDFARKVVLAVSLREGEIDRALLEEVVALARDCGGKPFHILIFAHDGSRRGELCAALDELGVAYGAPNVTVMGPAPGAAKEDEPAPRAILFGRTGGVAEEGPLGPGSSMLAETRKVRDAAPVIDISREDSRVPELARKVEAKQDFPATLVAIQKGMKDAKGKDEKLYGDLFVLDAFINGYYPTQIEVGKRIAALQPSLAVPFFEALDREFKDTTQGETIGSWFRHYRDSKVHAAAVTLERSFLDARRKLEAERCCTACGQQGLRLFRYDCTTCVAARKARIEAAIGRLRKLLKAKHDEKAMPFLLEVKRYMDELSALGS